MNFASWPEEERLVGEITEGGASVVDVIDNGESLTVTFGGGFDFTCDLDDLVNALRTVKNAPADSSLRPI